MCTKIIFHCHILNTSHLSSIINRLGFFERNYIRPINLKGLHHCISRDIYSHVDTIDFLIYAEIYKKNVPVRLCASFDVVPPSSILLYISNPWMLLLIILLLLCLFSCPLLYILYPIVCWGWQQLLLASQTQTFSSRSAAHHPRHRTVRVNLQKKNFCIMLNRIIYQRLYTLSSLYTSNWMRFIYEKLKKKTEKNKNKNKKKTLFY